MKYEFFDKSSVAFLIRLSIYTVLISNISLNLQKIWNVLFYIPCTDIWLFNCLMRYFICYLGPVVQSIISLTSSLRGQLLSVLDFITKYTEIFC